MASPAHCYYCFECISASFERREPISLTLLEELWEEHEQVKKLAVLQDKQDLREDDTSRPIVDHEDHPPPVKSDRPQQLTLPSINRLRSQPSSDSSSASTTPSIQSNNSSHSALSNSTTVTAPSPRPPQPGRQKHEERHYPLFVTWNTISKNSGHKSLRGCIGTFEAQELAAGLKSYALTSYVSTYLTLPYPALPTQLTQHKNQSI